MPDALIRKAKSTAAQQGQSFKEFVTEAVREKLAGNRSGKTGEPPWMRFFGAGKKFEASIREIDRVIEEEFEQLDPEE